MTKIRHLPGAPKVLCTILSFSEALAKNPKILDIPCRYCKKQLIRMHKRDPQVLSNKARLNTEDKKEDPLRVTYFSQRSSVFGTHAIHCIIKQD